MEENKDAAGIENTAEEVSPKETENVEETTEETTEESVDDLRAKLAKAEELAKNQKIRAEKAEKKAKENSAVKVETSSLSSKDIIAITKADIAEDDLDEVIEFAKFKKISVSEALKSPTVKVLLKQREEERATAEATNTSASRRSSTKVSDEALEAHVKAGKLPDNDNEIQRLMKKRMGLVK